jgi:hypothetical protein
MELIHAKLDIILEKLNNLEKINKNNNNNEKNNSDEKNNSNENNNDIITTIKTIKSNTSLNLTDNLKKTYKELKIEDFDIEYEFIKSCLLMNSVNGDIRLFKRMYIDNVSKEYYPIRHIKKKFQYWINDHMEDDNTN